MKKNSLFTAVIPGVGLKTGFHLQINPLKYPNNLKAQEKFIKPKEKT